MPVIAIGAAIAATATIATVGIAAMSTMAIIGAVGAIASGIGVITGNKTLMKIGAVAGLVGGIGSFISAGATAGSAAAGVQGLGEAGLAGGDALGSASEAAGSISESLGQVAPEITQASSGMAVEAAINSPAAAAGGGTGLINNPANSAMTQSAEALADAGSSWGREARSLNDIAQAKNTATSGGVFQTLGKVSDFMDNNKELTSMGMKFVGGLFDKSGQSKEEVDKAAADAYRARTSGDLLNQEQQRMQMANANAIPDLTGIKVKTGSIYNTAPGPIYNAPRPGLINATGR